MRILTQKFWQISLSLWLFLPSYTAAGESWDCGDWACSMYGSAKTTIKGQTGWESYEVFVPKKYIPDDCSKLNHLIFFRERNNLKSEFQANLLDFVFDDGSLVSVTIVAITDDAIELAPLSETPQLERYLREKNSFTITSGNQIVSGPYGLWGSNRAISSIALVCSFRKS